MPRCQRTFQKLPGSGPAWICGRCPDRETYALLEDPGLLRDAAITYRACLADFGPTGDEERPMRFVLGLHPECVLVPEDGAGRGGYLLYLQRGSDPCQLRLQMGHEIFHRVGSRGRVVHWTHEMLACLFAVRQLRAFGWNEYADRCDAEYTAQARALPLVRMRRLDLSPGRYPEGLYGRAYVTGKALRAAVGWKELCRLARTAPGEDGGPDLDRWLGSLLPSSQAGAELVLGGWMQAMAVGATEPLATNPGIKGHR